MVGSQHKDGSAGTYFRPTSAQVVAAVASLYADRLKPFGRILLKRVGEHAADAAAKSASQGKPPYGYISIDAGYIPRIDPKHLLRICKQCQQLRVEYLDSGEYAALLVGWPPSFVDPGSTEDPYPKVLWDDLAAYFAGPADDDAPLPGGRYNSARSLKARNLPFLKDRSLGEVCHILALAVSFKKILGHSKGHTVPYARSENGHKDFCASAELPVNGAKLASAGMDVATWDQVREGLRELLSVALDKGPGGIPMPNVKRLFRSRLGLELSETALGHSRVQDLLQDERLHDICEVQRQGVNNSYVVVRQRTEVIAQSDLMGAYGMSFSEAEPTYLQPPSLSGLSWLGKEPVQPAWISPTLLSSMGVFDAKASPYEEAPAGAKNDCPRCNGSVIFSVGPFGTTEIDATPCPYCHDNQWDFTAYVKMPPGRDCYRLFPETPKMCAAVDA